MIEAYAFLAMFAVQILVASVLYPARIITYVRGWERDYGSERFTQLYPGIDYNRWVGRFVTGYRAANIGIAVLGLLLLGWLFTRIQQPDWAGEVSTAAMMYFVLQMSPLALTALYTFVRYYKILLQPSQETKRKASLQRRGLFDFVSPFAVYFAVLSYFLFVVYGIWLDLYIYDNTTLSRALPEGHRLRHAGLRIECVHHLQVSVWQKKSARESRGSRAHDRCFSESRGLRQHRHRLVHLDLRHAWPAGFAGMETVRAGRAFHCHRAARSHGVNAPPRKPEADGAGSSSEVPS